MTPFVWAILAATCWGFAPMFEKAGLQGHSDPVVGVLVRTLGVILGALFMMPFIWRSIGPRLAELPFRNGFYLCMGGFLASIVGQTFFYRALKFGEISRVVPIGASYPLIAFVLGLVFWKEPFTTGKAMGVVLVMSGLYLLK